jgi:hypothetical protein
MDSCKKGKQRETVIHKDIDEFTKKVFASNIYTQNVFQAKKIEVAQTAKI